MANSQQSFWQKFFGSNSKWMLALIFVAVILVLFAYGRAYYQGYVVQREISRLQEEVRRLDSEKLQTLELLKYVKSPAFVEDRARLELNLVKPGEQVGIFTDTPDESYGQEKSLVVKSNRLSNPAKWWRFFMGGK